MQASGVQAMPRDAMIDVKGMHHSKLEIAFERIAAIAAKARTRPAQAAASWMFQHGIILPAPGLPGLG
ncbi:MAG TPA: hypothetical protein VID30_02995 [Bradyrhizobium sp.]|jgi:diketogulonate reductase-like aldo/keto reductase